MTITPEHAEELYRYIWSIIRDNKCRLIRVGGIANHVHLLIELNPAVSLAHLVRDIKSKSSSWLQLSSHFAGFDGWASEYFASTIGYENMYNVIEYIKNQQEHHLHISHDDEFHKLITEAGLLYHNNDLT